MENVNRFSRRVRRNIMRGLVTFADHQTTRDANTPCSRYGELSIMAEQRRPSIDGYFRELEITLVDPLGTPLKTITFPLDDLMPEHGSWRNAAEVYQLRIVPKMTAREIYRPLEATAFWNQGV